jgi:hypothetical protein
MFNQVYRKMCQYIQSQIIFFKNGKTPALALERCILRLQLQMYISQKYILYNEVNKIQLSLNFFQYSVKHEMV